MATKAALRPMLLQGLVFIAFAMPLEAQLRAHMRTVENGLAQISEQDQDSLFPAALFAAVYQNTIRMQLNGFAEGAFRDTLGMVRMSETFFGFFDSALRNFSSGKVNAPAWHAVFHPPGKRTLLHAMLLGIHAHVYNDLKPALMKAFDAEGLKAFRRDYFRLNRGFRCINRQKESQLMDAMQLKGWRQPVFRFGSRWMMRQFKHERIRAFRTVLRAYRKAEKGKSFRLVNPRRIQRNLRRLDALFRNPPLKNQLRKLDKLTPDQQLNLIRVNGCDT